MNCDTRLAINLRMFNLGENDEFIFAIKNYSFIESPYVFLFRAKKSDIDENGEVLFKITPAASKHLKPGAFYNFAVLHNAFDRTKPTEYKKLTDNGKIIIEYGAQDLLVKDNIGTFEGEIVNIQLEPIEELVTSKASSCTGTLVNMCLEPVDE